VQSLGPDSPAHLLVLLLHLRCLFYANKMINIDNDDDVI